MKTKLIKVLDEATELVVLIGKFGKEDEKLMNGIGWHELRTLTLITILDGGGYSRCCISNFRQPPYDLEERGNIGVNGTTVKLVEYVRDKTLEEIPDEVDLK